MPDPLSQFAEALNFLASRMDDLEARVQSPNQALDAVSGVAFDSLGVGAATGAGSGEVRATTLTAWNSGGTSSLFQSGSGTLITAGAGQTVNIGTQGGLLMVRETTGNAQEIIQLTYGGAATALLGSFMTLGSDAGVTFALFLVGSVWTLKNRYGANRGYVFWLITV